MNTFTLPSFAASGLSRMKMTRATTSTTIAAAAAVVVTSLARGGESGGRVMKSFLPPLIGGVESKQQ